MKSKYVKAFILGCILAAQGFTKKQWKHKAPYLFTMDKDFRSDISGIVKVNGTINGIIAISMLKLVAKKIVYFYSGQRADEDPALIDVVCTKFTNEIIQRAEENLPEKFSTFSFDSIVSEVSTLPWIPSVPIVCLPIVSELGEIQLFINLY